MSRLGQRLDILISVSEQGVEALKRPQLALKQLLLAQAELDRARGRASSVLTTLITLEQRLSSVITNQGRRELESLQIARRVREVRNEQAKVLREQIVQQARLAASQGQYARAESLLQRALRATTASTLEKVRIEQLLVQVRQRGAASAARVQSTLTSLTLAEGRAARAAGNHAREIEILNRALTVLNLTESQRLRLQTAMIAAEQRLARERLRAAAAATGATPTGGVTSGITGGLVAAGRAALNVFNVFTRILAAAVLIGFTIRTLVRTFENLVVGPLRSVLEAVASVTDRFRSMEASLTGVLGSLRAAKELTKDVREAAKGLPVTTLEALTATRGLAFIPGLAGQLQQAGPGRPDTINSLLRVLTGLATIDPDQGIEGARFAVREALAGEFRSLRFRFELSPDVVAATIGKTQGDLKSRPDLTLQALRQFTDIFVGDQAIEQFNQLLSTRAKLLRGVVEEFLLKVGDSGVYDFMGNLLDRMRKGIEAALQGGQLDGIATQISKSLEGFLTTILKAASTGIGGFIGRPVDLQGSLEAGDVAELGQVLADILDALGDFAGSLTLLVGDIGKNIGELATSFGLIGPITRPAISAALADREARRESLFAELNNRRPGGIDFTAQIQGDIAVVNKEIRDLKARLAVFGPGALASVPAVTTPPTQTDQIRELTQRFLTVSTELANSSQRVQTLAELEQAASTYLSTTQTITADARDQFVAMTARLPGILRDLRNGDPGSLQALGGPAGEFGRFVTQVVRQRGVANDAVRSATSAQTVDTFNKLGEVPPATVIRRTEELLAALRGPALGPFGTASPSTPEQTDALVRLLQKRAEAQVELGGGRQGAFGQARDQISQLQTAFQQTLGGRGPTTEAEKTISEILAASETAFDKIARGLDQLEEQFASTAKNISAVFGEGLTDALVDTFRTGGQNIGDILRELGETVVRQVTRMATEILIIRTLLNPFLNSAFGLTGTAGALPVASARGNVFSNRRVVPFQMGGLTAGPQVFPLGGNSIGVAGEAGDELIAPAVRDRFGRVGVTMPEGSRRGNTIINFNITTPDVDSFRRSQRPLMRQARRAMQRM